MSCAEWFHIVSWAVLQDYCCIIFKVSSRIPLMVYRYTVKKSRSYVKEKPNFPVISFEKKQQSRISVNRNKNPLPFMGLGWNLKYVIPLETLIGLFCPIKKKHFLKNPADAGFTSHHPKRSFQQWRCR